MLCYFSSPVESRAGWDSICHPALILPRAISQECGSSRATLALHEETPFIQKKKTRVTKKELLGAAASPAPLSRAQTGPAVALKHCHVLPAAPRLLLLSQSQPRPCSAAALAAKFSVKTITPQSCPAVMNTFHPVTGCTLDICNTALPGVSYSPSCSERQT